MGWHEMYIHVVLGMIDLTRFREDGCRVGSVGQRDGQIDRWAQRHFSRLGAGWIFSLHAGPRTFIRPQ